MCQSLGRGYRPPCLTSTPTYIGKVSTNHHTNLSVMCLPWGWGYRQPSLPNLAKWALTTMHKAHLSVMTLWRAPSDRDRLWLLDKFDSPLPVRRVALVPATPPDTPTAATAPPPSLLGEMLNWSSAERLISPKQTDGVQKWEVHVVTIQRIKREELFTFFFKLQPKRLW